MASGKIKQSGSVVFVGSTKSFTLQRKSGKTYLLFSGGGNTIGLSNETYGFMAIIAGQRSIGILHQGSAIQETHNTNTITVSCDETTLYMGYVEIGNWSN